MTERISLQWRPDVRRLAAGVMLAMALVGAAGCATKPPAELAVTALEQGLAAHVNGDLDSAAAKYQECLDLVPGDKLCLYNLGLVAQTQGRAGEAETLYRQALATDPAYGPALFNLAILRTAAGAVDEAIDLYRKSVTAQPDSAAGHLNLGLLLLAEGHIDEANAEITIALRLDPTLVGRIPTPAPTVEPSADPGPTPEPSAS